MNDEKDVTLVITAGGDTMNELLRLLSWMHICSDLGHNTKFDVEFLGDITADVRVSCLEGRKKFEKIKHEIFDDYNFNHKEPKIFSF